MVKMYLYHFSGASTQYFTQNKKYIGRTTKSGVISARDNYGNWTMIYSYKLTVNRFIHEFKQVSTFYLPNHKTALSFDINDYRPEEYCQNCGTDLIGLEIPDNLKEHYSPPYYWKRKIGIYDAMLDRTTHWQCPDCKFVWDRVGYSF